MSQYMFAQVGDSVALPRIADHVPSTPPKAALLVEYAPTMAEAVRHYITAATAAAHAVGDYRTVLTGGSEHQAAVRALLADPDGHGSPLAMLVVSAPYRAETALRALGRAERERARMLAAVLGDTEGRDQLAAAEDATDVRLRELFELAIRDVDPVAFREGENLHRDRWSILQGLLRWAYAPADRYYPTAAGRYAVSTAVLWARAREVITGKPDVFAVELADPMLRTSVNGVQTLPARS